MNNTVNLVTRLAVEIAETDDDLENNEITKDTFLERDLGFGSIDFVRLVVEVERELGRKLGFHDLLMPEGRYVNDLSVGDFCVFIDDRLNRGAEKTDPQAAESISVLEDRSPALDPDASHARLTPGLLRELRSRIAAPAPLKAYPSPKLKRALFILTPPRSGSTLLQLMLSGHPGIFAPPELYMLGYSSMQQRRKVLDTPPSRVLLTGAVQAVMETGSMSLDQAKSLIQKMEKEDQSVFDFYKRIQDLIGDRLLVDKSPLYTSNVDIMRRAEAAFDQPLYIHLVRHPAGMMKSFLDTRIGEMIPFAQGMECPPAVFSEMLWQVSHENISTFLEEVPEERFCRFQFEDLVKRPEGCMRRICGFLNLPFMETMANPYLGADGFSAAREVGRFSGDLKVHLYQGVESDVADRWRKHIPESSLSEHTLAFYNQLVGSCASGTTP